MIRTLKPREAKRINIDRVRHNRCDHLRHRLLEQPCSSAFNSSADTPARLAMTNPPGQKNQQRDITLHCGFYTTWGHRAMGFGRTRRLRRCG
ncbi:MAG: hypothetical protein ACK5Q5_23425 [Planctomycetaceae bacterium]